MGRSGATWVPKGAQMGRSSTTWVPKGAQMGCSGTTWALEWPARAPLECPRALKWAQSLLRSKPLRARSHCELEATVHSKPHLRSNPLLRSKPLCARSHCALEASVAHEATVRSQSLFEVTVRNNCSSKLSRHHCTLLHIALSHSLRHVYAGFTLVYILSTSDSSGMSPT